MSVIIKQNEMDEAALMTRALSLLGYIGGLFQDHGRKPLSERAEAIKEFVRQQTAQGNPYDHRDTTDKCLAHEFKLVEVLGEEPLQTDAPEQIAYAISHGEFSGEISSSAVTWVTRAVMDELLMAQGSDPGFLTGGNDNDNE